MSGLLPMAIVLMGCSIIQENVHIKDKICNVSECTDLRIDKPVSVVECQKDVQVKST